MTAEERRAAREARRRADAHIAPDEQPRPATARAQARQVLRERRRLPRR